jgi:type III pantothenate kinase
MHFPFIAVDIGNARMKIGAFEDVRKGTGPFLNRGPVSLGLPEPVQTLSLDGDEPELEGIGSWLGELERVENRGTGASLRSEPVPSYSWYLASVNRPAASRLNEWLRDYRAGDSVTFLSAGDLPLEVRLAEPEMVGIDRLVNAVAVNRLREPGRAAVIVDVGTAITVDLVLADGAFLGGAIFPGPEMAARAMHERTDLLPLVDVGELSDRPPALGTSTEAAMRSGLFWGTVGAIRELIEKLGKEAGDRPQVFLTGGAAASVAELLGHDAQYVPHLTLAGIALAAAGRDER